MSRSFPGKVALLALVLASAGCQRQGQAGRSEAEKSATPQESHRERIDVAAMPPLPEEFLPKESAPVPLKLDAEATAAIRKKLQGAFGAEYSKIQAMPIVLDLPQQGIVLAADEFHLMADGRMQLRPLAIAYFGGPAEKGLHGGTATLRCRSALLSFDRPVQTLVDLATHHVKKTDFQGPLMLRWHHQPGDQGEDLVLKVTEGMLESCEDRVFVNGQATLTLAPTSGLAAKHALQSGDRLTLAWQGELLAAGQEFKCRGHVEITEGNTHKKGRLLIGKLDRPLSFKQGPAARLERIRLLPVNSNP